MKTIRARRCGEPESVTDSDNCPDVGRHDYFEPTSKDIDAILRYEFQAGHATDSIALTAAVEYIQEHYLIGWAEAFDWAHRRLPFCGLSLSKGVK